MKKQTLPLFFTLLLSLLFLSACVPDLKINFKKEPTTSTSKKKTFKKVARVVQLVQTAQATPLARLQPLRSPLLTSSQPKDSLKMLKKLQKIRFMRQGT